MRRSIKYKGHPLIVDVDENSIRNEGPSDAGHGWSSYSFDATADDGHKYHGTVDGEELAGIMYWGGAELDGSYEPAHHPDPMGRMYDLSKKGPRMTPEEDAELRKLLKQHGRPKFMASREKIMTKQQSWVIGNCRFAKPKTQKPEQKNKPKTNPGCKYCEDHKNDSMMPPHQPSANCQSGKKPHCTCDVCY